MISLQGLEKVQVTIRTHSELLLESTGKCTKQIKRALAAFNQSLQTRDCYQICRLSLILSWLQEVLMIDNIILMVVKEN